ncbi:MAG: four helix bundle protein [Flavisolibacter sp.]
MPDQSAYNTIELYSLSKKLVIACYELTHDLPAEEKTNLSQYIRTASVTVHLNIAQSLFLKKKKKRKKVINNIQDALTIINAATEVLQEVGLITKEKSSALTTLTADCYAAIEHLKK